MGRNRWILFFLLCFVLAYDVSAVGFGNLPSQYEYIFSPGAEFEIPLQVINAPNIRASVSTNIAEDPATLGTADDNNILRYVTIVDDQPDGPPRTVLLRFSLPQQMRPGRYDLNVLSSEISPDAGGTIGAMAAARLTFVLHVLRQEKYIELVSFSVPPTPQGVDANATLQVISRTVQDINSVAAEVRVYRDGEVIKTVWSPSVPLPTKETATLLARIDTEDLEGGDYDVNATIHYDSNELGSWPETLKIGTLHVGLYNHSPNLTYNQTNRFLFTVSNSWNRELRDVFAEVTFGSQTKKSASQNIPPFGMTQYEVYMDRDETLLAGQATGNISVTFQDYNTLTKTYVKKNESFSAPIAVVLLPVPVVPWFERNLAAIAVGSIIIILLLLVLIIYLLFKRSKGEPAAQPQQAAPVSPAAKPVASPAAPKAAPVQATQAVASPPRGTTAAVRPAAQATTQSPARGTVPPPQNK